jgi:hypothetical protein
MLDDLKTFLARKPFMAFRILSKGGASYDVTSRFQVAIGQTTFLYCFPHSNRSAVLHLNQIAAFEDSEPAKS